MAENSWDETACKWYNSLMKTQPKTHRAARRNRTIKLEPSASATKAIGDLEAGVELLIMTYGQFSLGDALRALLKQTGPASVDISTWTAARVDIDRAGAFASSGEITGMRWLVDRSFATRQPGYCQQLVDMFGPDAIRTTRTHAKYAVIRGGGYNLAVRTSMNLNSNPRLEQIEISDDPRLADFLSSIHDHAWATQPPGVMDGDLITTPTDTAINERPEIKAGRTVQAATI